MSFAEGYLTRNRHNRMGPVFQPNGGRGHSVPRPNLNVTPNFNVPPPNFNVAQNFSALVPNYTFNVGPGRGFLRPSFSAPLYSNDVRARSLSTPPISHYTPPVFNLNETPFTHGNYSGSNHAFSPGSMRAESPNPRPFTPVVTVRSAQGKANSVIAPSNGNSDAMVSSIVSGLNDIKLTFQSEIAALRNEIGKQNSQTPDSNIKSNEVQSEPVPMPNLVNDNPHEDQSFGRKFESETKRFDFRPKFRDLPKYSGKDDDINPKEFIQEIDNFFLETRASEATKLSSAARQLTGTARVWFGAYSNSFDNYLDFKKKFLNHFWSEEKQYKVRASLCIPNQYNPDSGNMTDYFLKQLNLARRLDETIPEKSLIRDIVGHFSTQVKWAVTHCNANTVDTVIEKLQELDQLNVSKYPNNKPAFQKLGYQKQVNQLEVGPDFSQPPPSNSLNYQ